MIIQADNAKVFKCNNVLKFLKFLVDSDIMNCVYLDYMLPGHTKFMVD